MIAFVGRVGRHRVHLVHHCNVRWTLTKPSTVVRDPHGRHGRNLLRCSVFTNPKATNSRKNGPSRFSPLVRHGRNPFPSRPTAPITATRRNKISVGHGPNRCKIWQVSTARIPATIPHKIPVGLGPCPCHGLFPVCVALETLGKALTVGQTPHLLGLGSLRPPPPPHGPLYIRVFVLGYG